MDDNNYGSLIVYLILAILGVIGSINKGKKKASQGKPASGGTKSIFDIPTVRSEPQPPRQSTVVKEPGQTEKRSQGPLFTFDHEDKPQPYNRLSGEEGSIKDTFTERFSNEGCIDDPMALAFSDEGIKAFDNHDYATGVEDISAGQIGDAVEISDYDETLDEICGGKFNIRKAVIYSEILNRKEYAF